MNGRQYSECMYCIYYVKRDNQFPCNGCRPVKDKDPTLFVERGSKLTEKELSEKLLSNYRRRIFWMTKGEEYRKEIELTISDFSMSMDCKDMRYLRIIASELADLLDILEKGDKKLWA